MCYIPPFSFFPFLPRRTPSSLPDGEYGHLSTGPTTVTELQTYLRAPETVRAGGWFGSWRSWWSDGVGTPDNTAAAATDRGGSAG